MFHQRWGRVVSTSDLKSQDRLSDVSLNPVSCQQLFPWAYWFVLVCPKNGFGRDSVSHKASFSIELKYLFWINTAITWHVWLMYIKTFSFLCFEATLPQQRKLNNSTDGKNQYKQGLVWIIFRIHIIVKLRYSDQSIITLVKKIRF